MSNEVVAVSIKGVMPTANGWAVFLGPEEKTFVIYVDHAVGNALQLVLNGVRKDRPLTHDLLGHILTGLGARLEHVVINDEVQGTFYARVLIRMENEVARKIIEIDARPSDSLVLALQAKRPVYVLRAVLERVEDMTEVLERVTKQSSAVTEEPEDTDADEDYEEDDDSEGDDSEDYKP